MPGLLDVFGGCLPPPRPPRGVDPGASGAAAWTIPGVDLGGAPVHGRSAPPEVPGARQLRLHDKVKITVRLN